VLTLATLPLVLAIGSARGPRGGEPDAHAME
jgi:hypothetical protein